MTSQQKAIWIRGIFTCILLGAAIAAALIYVFPENAEAKALADKENAAEEAKDPVAESRRLEGKLLITNMRLDGNPNPEKLKELLEQLKAEKYGDKIVIQEKDITPKKVNLETDEKIDMEEFAGQLDFHADGKKLGDLIGHTDRETVERTIDRLLAGMIRRIDKDWLPDVPGMVRGK